MSENARYKVVAGSQSAHCCFEATVVDTTKPAMIGGRHYEGQFAPVCECFEVNDAQRIAAALNASDLGRAALAEQGGSE